MRTDGVVCLPCLAPYVHAIYVYRCAPGTSKSAASPPSSGSLPPSRLPLLDYHLRRLLAIPSPGLGTPGGHDDGDYDRYGFSGGRGWIWKPSCQTQRPPRPRRQGPPRRTTTLMNSTRASERSEEPSGMPIPHAGTTTPAISGRLPSRCCGVRLVPHAWAAAHRRDRSLPRRVAAGLPDLVVGFV
jgi:hypothetical protein